MSLVTDTSDVLTTREAAELVGRSMDSIKRSLNHGTLRGHHVEGFWRIRREDLVAWNEKAPRLARQPKLRPSDRVAELLAEYGSVTTEELAELLMVHVGNARKHLAILANQGRAHRHSDGEWFPGSSCPACLQEAAS
jgi:excisionase family DNA binding protein